MRISSVLQFYKEAHYKAKFPVRSNIAARYDANDISRMLSSKSR
jgi:hypothetical protein